MVFKSIPERSNKCLSKARHVSASGGLELVEIACYCETWRKSCGEDRACTCVTSNYLSCSSHAGQAAPCPVYRHQRMGVHSCWTTFAATQTLLSQIRTGAERQSRLSAGNPPIAFVGFILFSQENISDEVILLAEAIQFTWCQQPF